jgi:hypothetical protein
LGLAVVADADIRTDAGMLADHAIVTDSRTFHHVAEMQAFRAFANRHRLIEHGRGVNHRR